jgi:flagellum-specific peptidoglycan hydrolase FlgJ
MPTREYIDGRWVTQSSGFRVYNDIAESISDHAQLLATGSSYTTAMANRHSPDAFANDLTGVYATDPTYGSSLIQLMQLYNLYRYDTPTAHSAGSQSSGSQPAASHSAGSHGSGTQNGSATHGGTSGGAAVPGGSPAEPAGSGAASGTQAGAAAGSPLGGTAAIAVPYEGVLGQGGTAGTHTAGGSAAAAKGTGSNKARGSSSATSGTRAKTAGGSSADGSSAGESSAGGTSAGGSSAGGSSAGGSSAGGSSDGGSAGGGIPGLGSGDGTGAGSNANSGASSPASGRSAGNGTSGAGASSGGGSGGSGSSSGSGGLGGSAGQGGGTSTIPGVLDAYIVHQAPATSTSSHVAQTTRPARVAQRSSSARSTTVYKPQIPQAVTTAFISSAKAPLTRTQPLYEDVASTSGIRWELLAACDWMQCQANPRYSPVHGEKLGSKVAGVAYHTKSEALAQCANDLVELAMAVYWIDITARRRLSVRELAQVFAAFRWGGLLKLHDISALEFPYSVAGLTSTHLKMRWPEISEPDAPDKPGSRFRMPFGAVPAVLSLGYRALT